MMMSHATYKRNSHFGATRLIFGECPHVVFDSCASTIDTGDRWQCLCATRPSTVDMASSQPGSVGPGKKRHCEKKLPLLVSVTSHTKMQHKGCALSRTCGSPPMQQTVTGSPESPCSWISLNSCSFQEFRELCFFPHSPTFSLG